MPGRTCYIFQEIFRNIKSKPSSHIFRQKSHWPTMVRISLIAPRKSLSSRDIRLVATGSILTYLVMMMVNMLLGRDNENVMVETFALLKGESGCDTNGPTNHARSGTNHRRSTILPADSSGGWSTIHIQYGKENHLVDPIPEEYYPGRILSCRFTSSFEWDAVVLTTLAGYNGGTSLRLSKKFILY